MISYLYLHEAEALSLWYKEGAISSKGVLLLAIANQLAYQLGTEAYTELQCT